MRSYGIVSPKFWTGETGRELRKDPDAQRIAMYLMTCPMANMIGIYQVALPTLCHEVGISQEGASKGLARLSELGFASYSEETEWVFVTRMAEWQIGDSLKPNDKRFVCVQKLLKEAEKSGFVDKFMQSYGDSFSIRREGASKGLARGIEGLADLRSLQDQDQDQDQDQEQNKDQQQDQDQEQYKNAGAAGFNFESGKDLARLTERLRQKAGYSGGDGLAFEKAAHGIIRNLIAEADAMEAAQQANGKANPPGYFVRVMAGIYPDYKLGGRR